MLGRHRQLSKHTVLTGRNGVGALTIAHAIAGRKVHGVRNLTDGTDISDKFEPVVSTDGLVKQIDAGDYSTKTIEVRVQRIHGDGAIESGFPEDFLGTWRPLKIGAGGWLVGMDIAPDGSMAVRTDTYGGYIYDGAKWVQVVTDASMPVAEVDPDNEFGEGLYEIVFAPSDPNIMYMCFLGFVYKSIDKGLHWLKTNFASALMPPNTATRMFGQHMTVDPNNPNVVYVGTMDGGLFVTANGGTSWAHVASVPDVVNDPAILAIVFDPNSGLTSGKTNKIYVGSSTNGMYISTNAGSSFAHMSGSPDNPTFAAVGSDGVLWVCDEGNSKLWRYDGAWTEMTSGFTTSSGVHAVAISPFNPDKIVAMSPAGYYQVSIDGGDNWSSLSFAISIDATDIPWLEESGTFMSIGGCVFDPLVEDKLWVSAGVGVFTTQVPDTLNFDTPCVFVSVSAGIEQVVANDIATGEGNYPTVCNWDRPFYWVEDPEIYRDVASYLPIASRRLIVMGWSLSFARSNPSFGGMIANWFAREHSGYTLDGGKSYHNYSTYPSFAGTGIGGAIAVATPLNFIWASANNQQPEYTLDGAATWHKITLTGVTDWSNFYFAHYLFRRPITADYVNIGTFYMYFIDDAGHDGVYKSTNGGAAWTKVFTGALCASSIYNAKLDAIPGHAGHLLFTAGPQLGTNPVDQDFFYSQDGGTTWPVVANVKECRTFGTGKNHPDHSYPAIYMVGWVNNIYGIYQSIDQMATWRRLEDYPYGSLDVIKTIAGDPNVYGLVYLGFQGSGYVYSYVADAIPAPKITNLQVINITADGGTVTWNTDVPATSELDYGTTGAYGTNVLNPTLSTSHSIPITGETSSTELHIRVTSTNAAGTSFVTSDRTFNTLDITPPSEPQNLVLTVLSSSSIKLDFDPSTDDVAVADYLIYRDAVLVATSVSPSYTDTNLMSVTEYEYTVKARDTSGNLSTLSDPVSDTTEFGVDIIVTDKPPIFDGQFNTTAKTFSGTNIGASYVGKKVGVLVANGSGNAIGIASVEIDVGGGFVAMTQRVGTGRPSSQKRDYLSYWEKEGIDSSTTAAIKVTAETAFGLSVLAIIVINVRNAVAGAAADTGIYQFDGFSGAEPFEVPSSGDIAVPDNGGALVSYMSNNNAVLTRIYSAGIFELDFLANTPGAPYGINLIAARSHVEGNETYTMETAGASYNFSGVAALAIAWNHT